MRGLFVNLSNDNSKVYALYEHIKPLINEESITKSELMRRVLNKVINDVRKTFVKEMKPQEFQKLTEINGERMFEVFYNYKMDIAVHCLLLGGDFSILDDKKYSKFLKKIKQVAKKKNKNIYEDKQSEHSLYVHMVLRRKFSNRDVTEKIMKFYNDRKLKLIDKVDDLLKKQR